MREIPAEVRDLLKSRSMIGENKPSHEVTVGGSSGDVDFTKWTTERRIIEYGKGNMAATKDGRAIVSYVKDSKIYVAFADTVMGVLNGTEDFGDGTVVVDGTGLNVLQSSINLIDDILYLAYSYSDDVGSYTKLYTDDTGLGSSFVFKANVFSDSLKNAESKLSVVTKLGNGNLVIVCPYCNFYDSWDRIVPCYSTNKGSTWTVGAGIGAGALYGSGGTDSTGSILAVGDDAFIAMHSGNVSGNRTFMWINSGANRIGSWDVGWMRIAKCGSFFNYKKEYYYRYNDGIYKYIGVMPPDDTIVTNSENWTKIHSIGSDYVSTTVVIGNHVISSRDDMYVCGVEIKNKKLPVKSININRNKNMAGSLNLSIDNKNGEWSPDNTVNQNILFPNAEVIVKQGYGADTVQTFTGLIDRIEMSTFPQELKLSVRDKLKLALDQTITPQVITYTSQTVEDMFTDLATKAGLTVRTIETTGLTLAEKTFNWETYADCFSWLADLVGFEFGCDEEGKVYFKKDAIPQATDWILTFTDGKAQAYFPIVSGSDVLKSSDGLTTYTRDTDYEIDYETGELTSITIPDGETLMSYVFAAYSFKEGEDIISLGYTIDDNDIYSKVVVYGKNENDEVISAYKDYVSKDYYKVLSQKIMKIDASDADTVEKCQAIADRAEMLMRSRVRTVNFAAVAVPWLQVGDLIQVIESSTTISELYRITDLSTNMDSDGYTMQITCYHHSA